MKKSILVLLLILSFSLLPACHRHSAESNEKPARYGDYGAVTAINLARTAPKREPGSAGEQTALKFLENAVAELGYQSEVQPFSYTDEQGQSKQSANLIVKINGRGFSLESDYQPGSEVIDELEPPSVIEGRRLYILAHYDSYPGLDPALELEGRTKLGNLNQADGIHDNAAAVAVLLTLAKEAKSQTPGPRSMPVVTIRLLRPVCASVRSSGAG